MSKIRPYHVIAARARVQIRTDLGKPIDAKTRKLAALDMERIAQVTTIPAPAYRIEWCGNVQVHIPLTPPPAPDAYMLRREFSVASA